MTDIAAQALLAILRREIERAGGVRAFSRKVGINQSTVSQSANGLIPIPEAIANAVGFLRIVTFRSKNA